MFRGFVRNLGRTKNEADEPNSETANSVPEQSSARTLLQRLQSLLVYLTILVLCPLLIYSALKIFIFQAIFGVDNFHADVASGLGVIIIMHILMTLYTFKLMMQQEFSQSLKNEPTNEWDAMLEREHSPFMVVLLLVFYCLLIVCFPILTFFTLKFIVFQNLFLLTDMNADVISAIGAVIAVHMALALYIYRENGAGLATSHIRQGKNE